MKSILVFCLLVGCALAKPSPQEQPQADYIPILRSENEQQEDGSYKFSFETGNEIKREEIGEVRNAGQEDEFVAVHGSYSYKDPEGNLIEVKYTADENGFRAVGTHIHPSVGSANVGSASDINEKAAKSLEFNRNQPAEPQPEAKFEQESQQPQEA